MAGIDFNLSTVERATSPMVALDRTSAVRRLVRDLHVQECYDSDARLVDCTDVHPFAQAASSAFYRHYPLIVTPDTLWFCIAQGVAQHINLHAEELRHQFVDHPGQLTLVVERANSSLDTFKCWPGVFAEFSRQIATHVGPVHDWLVADFSTTGPVERAASEIVLMDAFQAYFKYEVQMGCGIPGISLLGTVADWESVRSRAAHFGRFGLDWWLTPLLGVLDAIVDTAKNRYDTAFWDSFFRYESNSGPAELTGWINVLFPYLKDPQCAGGLVRNAFLDQWHAGWQIATGRPGGLTFHDKPQGPALQRLPSGLNRVPVRIIDDQTGEHVDAHFIGGLFGVIQHPESLALRPEFGWAIAYPPIAATEAPHADDERMSAPRRRLHLVV